MPQNPYPRGSKHLSCITLHHNTTQHSLNCTLQICAPGVKCDYPNKHSKKIRTFQKVRMNLHLGRGLIFLSWAPAQSKGNKTNKTLLAAGVMYCTLDQCTWGMGSCAEKGTKSRQESLISKLSVLILNSVTTNNLAWESGGEQGVLLRGFTLLKYPLHLHWLANVREGMIAWGLGWKLRFWSYEFYCFLYLNADAWFWARPSHHQFPFVQGR